MQQSAWQDPPEYRGNGGMAVPTITPVVKRLLIATFGAFVFQFALSFAALDRPLVHFFGVTPSLWGDLVPAVWQLVTYGFLHSVADPMHIVWNMLWLYFLGTMLEGTIGGRQLLAVYFGAMIAGGLAELLTGLVLGRGGSTLGASGAVMGVTIAMATLRPNMRIILLFIPITLKWLALLKVGLDLFGLLSSLKGPTMTAHWAHLGGAAFGFAVARSGWIWRDPFEALARRSEERKAERDVRDRERVDELLAKISREGIQSLSASEKAFLKRASKR